MEDKFELVKNESVEIVLHNIRFGIYDFTYEEYYEYLHCNNIATQED